MAIPYDTITDIWKIYDIGVRNADLRQFLVSNYCDVDGNPTVDWLKLQNGRYRLTYSKFLLQHMQDPHDSEYTFHKQRAKYIIPRLDELGLNETHRVLVVGSGLAPLVHAFRRAQTYGLASVNYPNVWGIEGSQAIIDYYDSQKLDEDDATIWSDFQNKQPVKNALTSKTGDWHFNVIITEDVVEGLTVQEASNFFDDCEAALIGTSLRRIIHLVNPNAVDSGGLGFRFQSLSAWNTQRNHTFLHVDTRDLSNSSYVLGAA